MYIPNIILLGAVVRYDKKDLNVSFFSVKMDQREGQGTPDIGDMQIFYQNLIFNPHRCFYQLASNQKKLTPPTSRTRKLGIFILVWNCLESLNH